MRDAREWSGRGLSTAGIALAFAVVAPGWLPLVAEAAQIPCSGPAACPDLEVDEARLRQTSVTTRTFSETHCAVVEGMVPKGTHKLLTFTFASPNVGQADLTVGAPSARPDLFTWSPCHAHYHFNEYADYRLWTPEGHANWRFARSLFPTLMPSEVFARFPELRQGLLESEKRGFCVIDVVGGYQPYAPIVSRASPTAKYGSCSSNQGISVGWADVYGQSLDGQWFVIDGFAPGRYVLEAEVNPERLYAETSYMNNAAWVDVYVT